MVIQKYKAVEMDTAQCVEGFYYLENGFLMNNGKPDINRPVERHYLVDEDGAHREIAQQTLEPITE